MKKACMYLLLMGLMLPIIAQEKNVEVFYESGKLPEIVLKKAGEEFSVYYPDITNPDSRVQRLQNEFISYDLGKDFEGHDSYLLVLEVENGMLAATFDDTGKLLSVVERYNNARLPEKVQRSLAEKFPEWTMVKDKFVFVQRKGEIQRKDYKVIMRKGKKIQRVVINQDGIILRGKQ